MKTSPDVYRLIKAMTKQEKRYFKLHATAYLSSGSSNTYTELFDAYDRMKDYSGNEDVSAYLGRSLSSNQLASAKYELTRLVLNSLAAFSAGKTADSELRSMLAHIEILYNKGLYDHCRKVIARARRKAEQYEKSIYLVAILAWERRLLIRKTSDGFEDALRRFHEQQLAVLDKIALENRYEHLADLVQEANRSFVRLQDTAALEKLQAVLQSPLLENDPDTLPFHARIALLQIRANYEWSLGNGAAAVQWYRKAIDSWEAGPLHIADDPDNYKRYLANYLSCAIAIRKFDDFLDCIRKIKALPSASIEAETTIFAIVSYLELAFHLNYGQLSEALKLAGDFEARVSKYVERMRPDRLINLYYNCSIVYFLSGEYPKALEHISKILNEARTEPKRDIQEFTRVFRLLIHYELQDFEALDAMFRTARRFLESRGQFRSFEKSLVAAIRALLNAPDELGRNEIFRRLRSALVERLHKPTESEPLGLIEILFWVDSKIQAKPVREVYTAKMQAHREKDKRELFSPAKEF